MDIVKNESTFALYLRPDLSQVELPEWVENANAFNSLWDGIHMTLTSFRGKSSSNYPLNQRHGVSLIRVLQDMNTKSLCGIIPEDGIHENAWKIPEDADLELVVTKSGLHIIKFSKVWMPLARVCELLAGVDVSNPRPYDSLHLTLGKDNQNRTGVYKCPKAMSTFLKSIPQWFVEIEKLRPEAECVQRREKVVVLNGSPVANDSSSLGSIPRQPDSPSPPAVLKKKRKKKKKRNKRKRRSSTEFSVVDKKRGKASPCEYSKKTI